MQAREAWSLKTYQIKSNLFVCKNVPPIGAKMKNKKSTKSLKRHVSAVETETICSNELAEYVNDPYGNIQSHVVTLKYNDLAA